LPFFSFLFKANFIFVWGHYFEKITILFINKIIRTIISIKFDALDKIRMHLAWKWINIVVFKWNVKNAKLIKNSKSCFWCFRCLKYSAYLKKYIFLIFLYKSLIFSYLYINNLFNLFFLLLLFVEYLLIKKLMFF